MSLTLSQQYLRRHWQVILRVHTFFVVLRFALITPLFTLLLATLLNFSGQAAVADQDIARLLLTPAGLLGGIFLVGLWLAVLAVEFGAQLALAMAGGPQLPATNAIVYGIRHTPQLLQFALALTLRVLVVVLPFLLLLWLLASQLLGDYDINFYLSQRPPEFLLAAALGGALLLALGWLLGRRLVRWSLALPLLLFAQRAPGESFPESQRLVMTRYRETLQLLAGWLVLAILLSLLPALLLKLAGGLIVGLGIERLTALVVLLGITIILWLVLNLLISALIIGSLASVIAQLYERCGPPLATAQIFGEVETGREERGKWSRRQITATFLLAATIAIGAGVLMLQSIAPEDDVVIVAHRGAAGAAPENTLASVRRALVDGADWVEIDVQETRDGQVVVVHDSDFMKLAGNPLKIWEGDLGQIQEIDIGSWFGPEFSDQRPPTLAQVLEEVRGRAKLVIELKYYGHDVELEQRVIDLVEAAGMADQVVLMSLNLDGVEKVRQLRPDWTVGLLAATAVGDLTRLDVDFLAVSAGMASPHLVRRARNAGKPLFVWTVNDAVSLSTWMSRGVDGVITDEPALARSVLAERAQMGTAQRLLLAATSFFGKSPPPGNYRDQSP